MAQPNWITPEGTVSQQSYNLGTVGSNYAYSNQLLAEAVAPAVSITYRVISGSLPSGLTLSLDGLLFGTTNPVNSATISKFTVRATDNLNNIRDRTFTLTVVGAELPSFLTPFGQILDVQDSVWVSNQIEINNPNPNNPYIVRLLEGLLPPGLEVNENGLIRGYAEPPFSEISYPQISTGTTTTLSGTNVLTALSTTGFFPGRPVMFTSGPVIGDIELDQTYYVQTILNSTQYTISQTPNGPTVTLTNGTGFMTTLLPATTVGEPTLRTYNFTLQLDSVLGSAIGDYSIVVRNQNLPTTMGGLGKPANSRLPVVFNTRPETFNLNDSNPYYGYYVLPPIDSGFNTYLPTAYAYIGKIASDNYFAFKIIGHDFDNDELTYVYNGLPLGLNGDTTTGWITGTPVLSSEYINEYSFNVSVYKTINPALQSSTFYFSFIISNEIDGEITWVTPSNLGTINNGSVSIKSVLATSDVELQYRLTDSSTLPPNLTLLPSGEISGYVAEQPTSELLAQNESTTFTFTIEAYSPIYSVVKSQKTFTLTVVQKYATPTDTLYIKATPSILDREIIKSLLNSDLSNTMMPAEYLYRPDDIYFGKATDVVYEHAYGIYASSIDEYLAAITRNHYWRNITLGEIKTAQARDENGEIIYEVVYSQVIDNLVNPQGVSVSEEIFWPRRIDLQLGPWYTSVTDIYTSYIEALGQQYYTSLTSGSVRRLYPNSLTNMRSRVAQELGQENSSSILPLWMTSQQENGSTLGFTNAWVICYTKPGFSTIVKNNINTLWNRPDGTPYKLNQINFKIDRFSVDKSITYNYDKNLSPAAWTDLPSATPTPDPLDSKDFYVLFSQKTILPRENQQ